jgi:hypothetical protein
MFTRFQSRHFRCLKLIDQPLDRFQALVGLCVARVIDMKSAVPDQLR